MDKELLDYTAQKVDELLAAPSSSQKTREAAQGWKDAIASGADAGARRSRLACLRTPSRSRRRAPNTATVRPVLRRTSCSPSTVVPYSSLGNAGATSWRHRSTVAEGMLSYALHSYRVTRCHWTDAARMWYPAACDAFAAICRSNTTGRLYDQAGACVSREINGREGQPAILCRYA